MKKGERPPSRIADQFVLRLGDGKRPELKLLASQSRRSMNAEILMLIDKGIEAVYGSKNDAQ